MIKVFFGPMGASKTKTLLDMHEAIYFKDRIMAFSPARDNRFGVGLIQDRDSRKIEATIIDDIFQIEKHLAQTTKHVFIDEVNFFESEENISKGISLYELEQRRYQSMRLLLSFSLYEKINFYLFGLNLTAEMIPYGLMPAAIAFADERHELFAECADCGDEKAKFTYYIPFEKGTNVIGADDYCALCGQCHYKWEKIYKELKEKNDLAQYFEFAKILKPGRK